MGESQVGHSKGMTKTKTKTKKMRVRVYENESIGNKRIG